MGCFWSSESVSDVRLSQRRALSLPKPLPERETQTILKPLFGEYKCSACGRTWKSRLCWPDSYQICIRCKRPVYPHNQRALLPSDIMASKVNQEHKKELCQKCQQLGYYCGNFGKNNVYRRELSY
ncbi:unnamed protein product, partial [Iphiclides podalirius]